MRSLFVACLVAFPLIAAVDLWAGEPAPDPTPPPAGETLKILGASYNFGRESRDVTERVKELLRQEFSFPVSPSVLNVDPHPGKNKELAICCEVNGKFSMLSLREKDEVSRASIIRDARPVAATTDAVVEGPSEEDQNRKSQYADDENNFPAIKVPVSEQGGGVMQTVRLFRLLGTRVTGFRFKVDRTDAAAKQNVADKTKMDLYWTFMCPPEVHRWYIEPVKGRMQGFSNFFPLKVTTFRNVADLLPANKQTVIIQRLPADRLKEGEEYIMWFESRSDETGWVDMSISIGYRMEDRPLRDWVDLSDVAKSLGLEPAGKHVGYDERR